LFDDLSRSKETNYTFANAHLIMLVHGGEISNARYSCQRFNIPVDQQVHAAPLFPSYLRSRTVSKVQTSRI
jgi:hypothetical protein